MLGVGGGGCQCFAYQCNRCSTSTSAPTSTSIPLSMQQILYLYLYRCPCAALPCSNRCFAPNLLCSVLLPYHCDSCASPACDGGLQVHQPRISSSLLFRYLCAHEMCCGTLSMINYYAISLLPLRNTLVHIHNSQLCSSILVHKCTIGTSRCSA